MQVWGKILGCVFGFMFAKIPGAILGIIIGHFFDKGYSRAFDRVGGFSSLIKNTDSLKSRALFFHTLFSIMGHIAKSSGRVTEADIALASALMTRLNLTGDTRKEAQNAYNAGKKADFPIKETVKEFKQFCSGRAEFTQMYLEMQIQAALINGEINDKARQILELVAKTLNYSKTELAILIKQVQAVNRFHQAYQEQEAQKKAQQQQNRQQRQERYQEYQQQYRPQYSAKAQLQNAYDILGIDDNTPEKAAKKAYKKLMSQHHPDKLMAQGLPEQAMELAKEKTQDIQAAWQMIKTQKGW
ncbi:co-chaperone DjlA [Catenovulum sp. SM1970]|uniref:co-chaperone DjlA n=1 Tax=Marinifaba aquimaris TaxID=2741323 RepID=UPI0015737857|nr:co-chaperone DjlA [Marinifaba aquimaris]NTS77443.1 co-chaperone DjlA [Marinifaba aquimaris]